MYEMLTHMSPPLGLGKKCPAKIAYKVLKHDHFLPTSGGLNEMKTHVKSYLREINILYTVQIINKEDSKKNTNIFFIKSKSITEQFSLILLVIFKAIDRIFPDN